MASYKKIINKQKRKQKSSYRNIMNAILYLPKTSCQWCMIPKVPLDTSQSPPPPAGETHAGEDCSEGNEAPPPAADKH